VTDCRSNQAIRTPKGSRQAGSHLVNKPRQAGQHARPNLFGAAQQRGRAIWRLHQHDDLAGGQEESNRCRRKNSAAACWLAASRAIPQSRHALKSSTHQAGHPARPALGLPPPLQSFRSAATQYHAVPTVPPLTTGSVRGYSLCAASAVHCRRLPPSTDVEGAPQRLQNRCACLQQQGRGEKGNMVVLQQEARLHGRIRCTGSCRQTARTGAQCTSTPGACTWGPPSAPGATETAPWRGPRWPAQRGAAAALGAGGPAGEGPWHGCQLCSEEERPGSSLQKRLV
jgi:hypothetical protein